MLVVTAAEILKQTKEFLLSPLLPGGKDVRIELDGSQVENLIFHYIKNQAQSRNITIYRILIDDQYVSLRLRGENVKKLLGELKLLGKIKYNVVSEFYGSYAMVIKLNPLKEISKLLTKKLANNLKKRLNLSGKRVYGPKSKKSRLEISRLSKEQIKKIGTLGKDERLDLYICDPNSGSKFLMGPKQIVRAPEDPYSTQTAYSNPMIKSYTRTTPGNLTVTLDNSIIKNLLEATKDFPNATIVLALEDQIIASSPVSMLRGGTLHGSLDKNLGTADYQDLVKKYKNPLPAMKISWQSKELAAHPLHNWITILISGLILLAIALYLVLRRKKLAIVALLLSCVFLFFFRPAQITPLFLLVLLMNLLALCFMNKFVVWIIISFFAVAGSIISGQFLLQFLLALTQLIAAILVKLNKKSTK
jgi:hypothetical protein